MGIFGGLGQVAVAGGTEAIANAERSRQLGRAEHVEDLKTHAAEDVETRNLSRDDTDARQLDSLLGQPNPIRNLQQTYSSHPAGQAAQGAEPAGEAPASGTSDDSAIMLPESNEDTGSQDMPAGAAQITGVPKGTAAPAGGVPPVAHGGLAPRVHGPIGGVRGGHPGTMNYNPSAQAGGGGVGRVQPPALPAPAAPKPEPATAAMPDPTAPVGDPNLAEVHKNADATLETLGNRLDALRAEAAASLKSIPPDIANNPRKLNAWKAQKFQDMKALIDPIEQQAQGVIDQVSAAHTAHFSHMMNNAFAQADMGGVMAAFKEAGLDTKPLEAGGYEFKKNEQGVLSLIPSKKGYPELSPSVLLAGAVGDTKTVLDGMAKQQKLGADLFRAYQKDQTEIQKERIKQSAENSRHSADSRKPAAEIQVATERATALHDVRELNAQLAEETDPDKKAKLQDQIQQKQDYIDGLGQTAGQKREKGSEQGEKRIKLGENRETNKESEGAIKKLNDAQAPASVDQILASEKSYDSKHGDGAFKRDVDPYLKMSNSKREKLEATRKANAVQAPAKGIGNPGAGKKPWENDRVVK